MRKLMLVCVWLSLCASANAEGPTDRSPVLCAWSQLSPAEQTELREAFQTERTSGNIRLNYAVPAIAQVERVMAPCHLSYTGEQAAQLARALGAKAAEELARWGVGHRGAIEPEMIDKSLAQFHEGKRVLVGDALSCTGTADITHEWDQAAISAMRRAKVRTVDGRTVSLVGIAMYSVFVQEGHMRRINGAAGPCQTGD